MEQLLSCDTYEVYSTSPLFSDRLNVLSLLYQPLIGSSAMALYLTLYAEIDLVKMTSLTSTHARLTMQTAMPLDKIKENIKLLEGIGLVKSYVQFKDNHTHYLYEMLLPLDAKRFYKNELLNVLLYRTIGSLNYEKNKFYFTTAGVDLDAFEETTASFDEVFYIEDTALEGTQVLKGKSEYRQEKTLDPVINYPLDLFYKELKELQVRKTMITSSVETKVKQLGVVYHISGQQMAQLVYESIEDYRVNEEVLAIKARNYHELEAPQKFEMVYHSQPIQFSMNSQANDSKSKHIKQLETWSPYKLIAKKQGSTPTRRDLSLVEKLMLEQGLEPGVINVLLELTWAQNDNRMPRNYVEAIAASWKRKGIKTVTEAMQEAKNYMRAKTKNTNDNMPEWYKNQQAESKLESTVQTNEDSTSISEEELRELMNSL